MNAKSFGILILATLVLVVLAIVGQGRVETGSIAGDTAGSLLLASLTEDLSAVDGIQVEGAGRQRLVSLERVDNEWRVSEVDGYPAEVSKVNALLIALAETRIVEEKTANPELHSRLGVEDITDPDAAGIELTLLTSSDNSYAVVLGETYSGNQIYARIPDDNQSVLIDRNPDIGREPSEWVVTEIIDLASDRVQRVEITHADGERLVIAKETRDAGNFGVEGIPEGRELQYDGVANVTANLLQGLRLDAVERRADEDSAADVVSDFWMFDGLVVTVNVLGEGDDAWLEFSARFDVDQALAFADEPVENLSAADQTGEVSESERPARDALDEAEDMNSRLANWRYRIPSYQLNQLTRRMEDLLQAEAVE